MSLNPHVISCTIDPNVPPTKTGQHWINTTTGDFWFSIGTVSVGDWVKFEGDTDEKVNVSVNDSAPGYLLDKIVIDNGTNTADILESSELNDGADEDFRIRLDETKIDHANIQNIGTNTHTQIDTHIAATNNPHNTKAYTTVNTPAGTDPVADTVNDTLNLTSSDSTVTITGTAASNTIDFIAKDEKAKVTSNDTTPGYLYDKIQQGTNITITENNDGGNETMTISATGSLDAEMPVVQLRRTTVYIMTNSYVDITFDQTDEENDSLVLEHDNVNTDRILVKESGMYLIQWTFAASSSSFGMPCGRIRVNDAIVLPGSEMCNEDGNDENIVSAQFVASLTGGDFLTMQAKQTAGSHQIERETVLNVIKLSGAQGPVGSGSNVTVKDEGTSITGTPHSNLNFTGAGVTVTDEGGGQAKIDIPGGGGSGDVTAAVNIADNRIVRGDGGVKGVQDSLWTIADDGAMTIAASLTGYILDVQNTHATLGNGVRICGGEVLGDITLKLCDADSTHNILEVEADQGYFCFFKTYADTLAANGIVHGIDNQDTGLAKDFNTEHGCYRVEGEVAVCKNNFTATVAPGVNDDSTLNYAVGSRWINTTTDKEYVCSDATATAAVWTETTQSGGGGSVSQATATASTTTTSTSYVLVNSMTLTPGTGNYMVMFTSSWKNSGAQNLFASIYVGGVQVTHTERMTRMESSTVDTELSVAAHAYVTGVGAADAIEIRWKTTGGTATMLERTLTAQQV